MADIPAQARIVVIGGGAIGCSIAYHLAKLGERDVVVLEKAALTHGSTWHAAGLVGQLRSKRNLTRLMQYSARLYATLEEETGQAVEWKPVGSLRLASSEERWSELKRMATTARSFDFELHTLSVKEAVDKFPLIEPKGVVGAVWVPNDGSVDPSSLTQAYARGAKKGGVKFIEGIRVTGFGTKDRHITSVRTDKGEIACEIVVNAAGIWARDVAKFAGVSVPAGAVEHQYLITEKRDDMPKGLPTLRDPDNIFYLKPEPGALAIGGWEQGTPTFGAGGMNFDFGRELLPPNQERLEAFVLPAAERLPILNEIGIRTVINGPILISPTASRSWAWRPSATISMSRAASPRASRRRAVRARRWPNGSSRASRRWICGRSTCAASASITCRRSTSPSAASMPIGAITRSITRSRNSNPRAADGAARFTTS